MEGEIVGRQLGKGKSSREEKKLNYYVIIGWQEYQDGRNLDGGKRIWRRPRRFWKDDRRAWKVQENLEGRAGRLEGKPGKLEGMLEFGHKLKVVDTCQQEGLGQKRSQLLGVAYGPTQSRSYECQVRGSSVADSKKSKGLYYRRQHRTMMQTSNKESNTLAKSIEIEKYVSSVCLLYTNSTCCQVVPSDMSHLPNVQ